MTEMTTHAIGDGAGADTAEVLFDPARLSELVGAQVWATRLRHKAGHSTVAALTADDGPVGWIRVVQPQLTDKLHNIARRAHDHGRRVLVRDVPGRRLRFSAGGIATDPRLIKALGELAPRPEVLDPSLGIDAAEGENLLASSDRVLRDGSNGVP